MFLRTDISFTRIGESWAMFVHIHLQRCQNPKMTARQDNRIVFVQMRWPTLGHVLCSITVVIVGLTSPMWGMLIIEYEQIAKPSLLWHCPDCGTANHSTVLYEIPILNNSQNIICSSANT